MKSIYQTTLPYIKESKVEATKDYLNNTSSSKIETDNSEKLQVNELNIVTEELEESHFSKDTLHLVTKEEQELMDFGTEVHELLEQTDFTNFIPPNNISNKIVDCINNFINTDLIQENINSKMYKEYEFIYNKNNAIKFKMCYN